MKRPQESDKPNAYVEGHIEFYKLKFKVTSDVLIPRPETELLVDSVLEFIRSKLVTGKLANEITILDIGTGAGNIAISITKNLPTGKQAPNVKIIATDVSEKALKIARQNAKLHGVENKIEFIQSDLLSAFNNSELITQNSELIIVTNLPYIPSARIPYLDSSVKDFEPHVALDGEEDGFGLYRKLFQQIGEKNWKPDFLVGEIDYTHGELAANEAQKYFPGAEVEIRKDLAHMQRILFVRHDR